MKRLITILLVGVGLSMALTLQAQELVDYQFKFNAVNEVEGELKELTKVTHAGASSIRLYFNNVELDKGSYLLLEGEDGALQKMDATALKNWRNSSAYFNGSEVKVSLYQEAGSENSVEINQIKIAKRATSDARDNQRLKGTENHQAINDNQTGLLNDTPQGKATGRFTNGSDAFGTGWIAPNGCIVTSNYNSYSNQGYDIIEFNVPSSSTGGIVNHPDPEDQYPIDYYKGGNVILLFKGENHTFFYVGSYAILKALPNAEGLLPGEKQGEYFRIATNPSSFVIDAQEGVPADIFHYGDRAKDILIDKYKTLKISNITLDDPKKKLKYEIRYDREDLIVYSNMSAYGGSDTGAPITYRNSNVAIGVHVEYRADYPSFGIGFRHDKFRTFLNNFFTEHVVYVDAESLYPNSPEGNIVKPFASIQEAVDYATDDDLISIARGNYNESVKIDRPMKLKAPVGTVVIGSNQSNSRMANSNVFPEGFAFEEKNEVEENVTTNEVSIKGYPNPFVETYELDYVLPESVNVIIKIFDVTGTEVRQLLAENQDSGAYNLQWDGKNDYGQPIQSGMYLVKMQLGNTSKTLKIIKN